MFKEHGVEWRNGPTATMENNTWIYIGKYIILFHLLVL